MWDIQNPPFRHKRSGIVTISKEIRLKSTNKFNIFHEIRTFPAVTKLDEQVKRSKLNIFHDVDNLEPCSSISLYSMKLTILTPNGEVERLKGQTDLNIFHEMDYFDPNYHLERSKD